MNEIGAYAPDGLGPVDARPATYSGIQDDGVESGKGVDKFSGEGADGHEVAEVDALGNEVDAGAGGGGGFAQVSF